MFLEPFGPGANTTTILKLKQMITKAKDDRNAVMWHKRLAHMRLLYIHNLINSHYLYDMKMVKKMKCVDCKGLKPHIFPLPTRLERATKCMKCIHMTIYGPHHIANWARQRYMICFVDEYSNFETINFAKKVIDVRQIVDDYIAKAKRQRDDQVKLLKVEIEDEFMKDIHKLISLSLEVMSIPLVLLLISQTSRVGMTEKNCTKLMSMVNLMYLETLLPHSFWDSTMITASYILNHTPNSNRLKTFFEIWMGYKESLKHLHV